MAYVTQFVWVFFGGGGNVKHPVFLLKVFVKINICYMPILNCVTNSFICFSDDRHAPPIKKKRDNDDDDEEDLNDANFDEVKGKIT